MKSENQFDGTIWLSDETKKEIQLFDGGANIYEDEELKTRYECDAITEAIIAVCNAVDEVETMLHNLCTMFNGLIIDEA